MTGTPVALSPNDAETTVASATAWFWPTAATFTAPDAAMRPLSRASVPPLTIATGSCSDSDITPEIAKPGVCASARLCDVAVTATVPPASMYDVPLARAVVARETVAWAKTRPSVKAPVCTLRVLPLTKFVPVAEMLAPPLRNAMPSNCACV